MATLRIQTATGREHAVGLARRITTLGRGAENDVVLPDPGLPETALHIHFDGKDFNAACHGGAHMEVNGRRKVTARLVDGDRIRLGESELRFQAGDPAPAARAPSAPPDRLQALETLV